MATMWSVVRNGHYCAMITTFEDGKWSKFSPGKVIILRLLHMLKADGYRCFDMGYGDEPWKQGLRDQTVPLRDYIRVTTLRGACRDFSADPWNGYAPPRFTTGCAR